MIYDRFSYAFSTAGTRVRIGPQCPLPVLKSDLIGGVLQVRPQKSSSCVVISLAR